jgi:hypothetical protein
MSDLFPSRSIDSSQMHGTFRPAIPSFEIPLPFPKSAAISPPTVSQERAISPNIRRDRLFNAQQITLFFKRLEEEHQISISSESRTFMLQKLLQTMSTVLLGAVQDSRRACNFYVKPPSEREFTSCPAISHHFLSLELYYSNYIRRNQFIQGDDYEPKFITEAVDHPLFPRQEGTNESGEQWQQSMKIFQTLKQRGLMFRTVAKEKDGASYLEKVDEMIGTAKGQQANKATGPSPRAADIFGRKDVEDRKKAHRRISSRDIMTFVMEWAKKTRLDRTQFMFEMLELSVE